MSPTVRPSGPYVQVYATTQGGPVRWRMLTGNNRELGRGNEGFADVDACHSAYQRVVTALAELTTSCVPAAQHRWTWRLGLAGEVLVVAAHSFDRRARCELAAAQFLREAPRAALRDRVLLTQPRRRPLGVLL